VATPSSRRLGAADSQTRARLLDAAERLLLEDGYAAVTSRRVGAAAGLKPQLVHYYFQTMDDLFVEVFRRRADESLEHFARAVAADPSLHTLWRLNADPRGAALMIEFAALANHRKSIRAEIARYAERSRAAQLDALAVGLADAGVTPDVMPPVVFVSHRTLPVRASSAWTKLSGDVQNSISSYSASALMRAVPEGRECSQTVVPVVPSIARIVRGGTSTYMTPL